MQYRDRYNNIYIKDIFLFPTLVQYKLIVSTIMLKIVFFRLRSYVRGKITILTLTSSIKEKIYQYIVVSRKKYIRKVNLLMAAFTGNTMK